MTAADEASDPALPDGVIGTARVTGADGAEVAGIEIVSDGTDELEVRLIGLTPQPEQPREVLFAPDPLAAFRAVNSVVGPFTKRGIGAPPLVGVGTVTVATTGRRSGRAREVPLAAARVGDTVVVSTVRPNSEWVRNLESDPTTTIWLDGCARQAEASVQRMPGLTVATLRVNR